MYNDITCYDYFYLILGIIYFIPSITILLFAWNEVCPSNFKPWIITMLIIYVLLLLIRIIKYYNENYNIRIIKYTCYIGWVFCYLANIISVIKKCDNYIDKYNYCTIAFNTTFLLTFIIQYINNKCKTEHENTIIEDPLLVVV
jgi:hypothetical protein